MALTPNSQYVFTDLNEQRVFVQSTDLLDRGTWTNSLFYSRYNVVTYLGALYVCVSDNIGVPPNGTLSDEWSLLVVVSGTAGTEASAQAAYDLALAAYSIAVVGTNAANAALAAATAADATATHALMLAMDALSGVDTVLNLAVTGTNVANEALAVAISGTNTANAAFSIAVIGTNSAAQAEHDALIALHTAWSGTAGVQQAFALAAIGTNASANSAVAVTALHTAWSGTAGVGQVLALASIGTNVGTNALNLAQQAYDLAVSGTVGGSALALAQAAYNIATIGTNVGTNAYTAAQQAEHDALVALQTAWSGTAGANQAFGLAAIGTNVGTNALNLAQQAYDLAVAGTTGGALQLAQAAFSIAVQGTNATLIEVAARIFGDGTTLSQAATYTDSKVSSGSQYAFSLYVTGTNYTTSQVAIAVLTAENYADAQIAVERAARVFGDGTVAQNGSQYSFGLWVAGTQYTDNAINNAVIGAGSSSLSLYWAGTTYTNAAVASEAAARASAITVEAGARVAGDAANAANISVNAAAIAALQNILGISVNGTVSYYMAQTLRGKPDTKVTLVNGVLTGIVQSPFVWDDFSGYSVGPATNLNKGSSWATPQQGSISVSNFTGTVAQDPFQTYAAGTFQIETDLYGFATNGTFAKPYINYLGVDSFEQYAVGTIWNPQLSAGTEFISPAVLFAL